jgi:adenosylmethionine-8-amino-7-oxononanoate aminotransferase
MKQILPFTKHSHSSRQIKEYDAFGYTTADGQHFIDAQSTFYSYSLGFKNAEILQAIHDGMSDVPYVRANKDVTHAAILELQDRWSSLSDGYLTNVFYGLGGSDSVDTSIKLALNYHDILGEPQRTQIISFRTSYHGSTLSGTYVSGFDYMNLQTTAIKPDWIHYTSQPYFRGNATPEERESEEERCLKQLRDLIGYVGPNRIAAIIQEPISWVSGVVECSESYHSAIKAICNDYGILLIVDDVATCGGKLGTYFGYQRLKMQPDIVCSAKSLTAGFAQLSATFCNSKVGTVIERRPMVHGWTFCPAMPGVYAALKTIEILRRDDLMLVKPNEIALRMTTRAQQLIEAGKISDFRVCGTFASLVLNTGSNYERARISAMKHGIMLGAHCLGPTSFLSIGVPLNIDSDTLNAIFDGLSEVL